MINGTIEEYKSIGINEELRSNIIAHLSKKMKKSNFLACGN